MLKHFETLIAHVDSPMFPGVPAEHVDTGWGHLLFPSDRALEQKIQQGLRVAVFGSFWRGMSVLSELSNYEARNPTDLNVVGFCTDEVDRECDIPDCDGSGKISAKKRVWQYVDATYARVFQAMLQGVALNNGVPVYTGSVKVPFFQSLLNQWRPDVILMSTFGQLIPPEVFGNPPLGMYNFHPSDLAQGKFPGPNPFQEMTDAGEDTTRMTLHEVDAGFDTGSVVGFSPPINIRRADGSYPDIPALHAKTAEAAGHMAVNFVRHLIATRARCSSFDFKESFNEGEKEALMEPVRTERREGVRVPAIELK